MRAPEDDLLDDMEREDMEGLTLWTRYADDDYDPAPAGFQLRDRGGKVVPRDPD